MQRIRVAAVSPRFAGGDDKQSNLESAWRGIQAAKAQGAELAVFSELYLIHCLDERSYRAAEPVPEGPVAQQVIRFARESGVTVAIGIEELDPNTGVVYNTHFLAGPRGYVGKHRKTHLMVSEWRAHRPGCEFEVFDIAKCKVGMSICHENMYPEISRIQSLKGMEVSISPFAVGGAPERVPKDVWLNDFHMACWRARCFDNGIFMIVSGGNGSAGKKYRHYACIIDPWADVIASIEPDPDPDDVNIVVADLDPERFISRRTDPNYPLKKRRPELFDDLVRRY